MNYLTEEKLKDFRDKFGDLFHYINMVDWIENEINEAVIKVSRVDAVVMQLHKEAELIEKEAALHYDNKELHNMHTKMDLARSLRTAANYLDGVQSA